MADERFVFWFDDPEPEPDPEPTIEENTNVSTDFAPHITIDHVNRLHDNINKLREVLGIAVMKPASAGSVIKRYTRTVTKPQGQVDEGEVIPLTKVTRTAAEPLTLSLTKFRRLTTAEAIQAAGTDIALNDADAAVVAEMRKDIKSGFFTALADATGTATGTTTLQGTLAAAWGELQVAFEDIDCTPVFFVSPVDVATYLGTATISTQTAFGFDYLENFLGLGTAVVSAAIPQGTIYATAKENLNGVYIPQGGDLAKAFSLTYDESGMVGLTHTLAADRASVQSLLLSGVLFYAEDLDKVIKAEITT